MTDNLTPADRRRAYTLIRHRATGNEDGMRQVLVAGLPRGPQLVCALCDAYITVADHWHTDDDRRALVAQLDQTTHSPDPVQRSAAAIVMLHGISRALDEPATLNQQLEAIADAGRIGTLTGAIIDLHHELLPRLTDQQVLDWLSAKAAQSDTN